MSPRPTYSRSRWILRTLIVLVLISGGFIGYYFYFRAPEGPNVSLEFSKPNQILLGQPFTVTVSYSNYSDTILKDARFSLFLPEGVSFLGQFADQRVIEQVLGDVGPGSLKEEKFNLIVTTGSQTLKHLEAKLAYSIATNAKAQFESKADVDLLVSQPAVTLTFDSPTNVLNGESFDMTIRYQNNTNQEFKNLRLKVDYPPIFKFEKSSTDPEGDGNNTWNLVSLPANASGDIKVTGSALGPEQSFFTISGTLTADFLGQTYSLNTQTATMGIAQAPLSLKITVNDGGSENIARAGDMKRYVLTYKNNSSIAFQNITIKAKLIGDLFDFGALRTSASLNSLTNTLTWFTANTPQLANLSPGEEKTVDFDIKLKDSFPIQRLSDKNYTLRLEAEINSPTVPPNTASQRTISVTSLENKVAGKIKVGARAYWRDAASGILNSGSYPPQVNNATQYTIHWLVTNYATDVSGVKVSAYLQSGAWFTGKVKSNIGSQPVFDSEAGIVTWQIDSLPATKGVVSAPAEAIFQIEATPAVNQAGQHMPLVGETKIEAQDVFTGTALIDSSSALDTQLPDDKTIPTDADRRVKP